VQTPTYNGEALMRLCMGNAVGSPLPINFGMTP
jgi:hypothetical protein